MAHVQRLIFQIKMLSPNKETKSMVCNTVSYEVCMISKNTACLSIILTITVNVITIKASASPRNDYVVPFLVFFIWRNCFQCVKKYSASLSNQLLREEEIDNVMKSGSVLWKLHIKWSWYGGLPCKTYYPGWMLIFSETVAFDGGNVKAAFC